MVDSQMDALMREMARNRHPETSEHRSRRHPGLQRSAREISLAVRRQRRHGEAA